jgi:hypothetical protein
MRTHARRFAITHFLGAFLVTALVAAPASPAFAEGGPFGLGIIIGSPTGLSGKLYLNRTNAIDFAVGAAFLDSRGLHAHVDYLWHPVMIASDEAFYLPLYLGLGVRILDHDHGRDDDDTHLGIRAPLGILFDFKRVPIDVFAEIALIIDIVDEHDDLLDLNAGIGIRYYF